ncbi:methanogen output domain 1-containing protein [Francisella sp. 19X1-34]|uniref:methanogen output domain 1-containing protein n=1 Tax=Francisella sp. 19X1-34 TaxID=3087177 RepID=UPI002E353219|nr:methanogen output domain 1-containing protein [Francisella sp. 19X1-34]MED7788307.1 methanogen output domain 1-containing protein [Francisella sp. 19X1-34]
MKDIQKINIPLERDGFLRTLLRHLTGTLQDTVGEEDSKGFVSVVGQVMGEEINMTYKNALSLEKIPKDLLSKVLVDLKERIKGEFYIIEETEDKIVFGNKQCPFAEKVIDRPSLCMMTTNVFGTIASDSTGYAKVSIDKAIANGDKECLVTVYLNPKSKEAKDNIGREFIGL